MPNRVTKNHQANMSKICGVCSCKSINLRNISPKVLELIKKHHYAQYDLESMPTVICTSCIPTLNEIDKKGKEAKKKLPIIDYRLFVVQATRSQVKKTTGDEVCDCRWCWIGRLQNQDYLSYKESVKQTVGRPRNKENQVQEAETVKRCVKCLVKIGKGINHNCTLSNRYSNLVEMTNKTSIIDAERVTSKLLNKKCEDEHVSKKTGSLTLASGSKQLTVNFGERSQPQISHKEMIDLKKGIDLSGKQVNAIGTFLRYKLGRRDIIEPGARAALQERAKSLEDFFTVQTINAVQKKKIEKETEVTTVPKTFVCVNDIEGFTDHVLETRGLDRSNFVAIIGIDEGQKSIKVYIHL